MNKTRILVDGYNLGLEQGSGIATYARNLIATLKNMGCELTCLYDRRVITGPENDLINEIYFFDRKAPIATYTEKSLHVLREAIRSTKLIFNSAIPLKPIQVHINRHVITKELSASLPNADRFFSYERLFRLSFVYFLLTGRFIRIQIPDIDIAHWTFPIPLEAVGAKNIYTVHDIIPIRLPYTTMDNKRMYDLLMRKLIDRADRIVTVSEFSRTDIIATYTQAKPKLFNTYQCARIPEKFTKITDNDVATIVQHGFNLEYKNYYLAIGAFEPRKNYGRLIDAYLTSGIQAPLVIVGPDGWKMEKLMGSYDERLHRQIRMDSGKVDIDMRVIRIGYVQFSMLINLIRGAKVLCFPSLYEGFGLPVLEAMTLGIPVLTSNCSSLPEIGGEAAIYVDPYDVHDIRKMLLWCENNSKELKTRAELGLQQAEKFSMDQYASALGRLYEN